MSFQAPLTIRKVLENIETKRYFLPAIQREFVWETWQIEQLFDSILRGYPIGSFLFWQVSPANSKEYEFYEFIRDYHERDGRHNQKVDFMEKREVIAALDGQQRLTALNIGLRGSYAARTKWKWRTSPDAYLRRALHLNLLGPREDDEYGTYDFAFLTAEEASSSSDKHWFRASDILEFKAEREVNTFLAKRGLANHDFASGALFDFFDKVNKSAIINYYLEEDQDLDKVLRIFIRVNSGGTQLAYSDLLLSTATAQWKSLNARDEINALVDQLNGPDHRFNFDKDLVMKACLVLTDEIQDIRFKVTNFNATNTKKIEDNWKNITEALRQAVALLMSFGLSERSLTSANSVLPIAYYLLKRGLPANYDSSTKYLTDRAAIRQWLFRSLLRGAFGAQGDTVLTNVRSVIRASNGVFPADALAEKLHQMNRPIRFSSEDIDDLLSVRYGQKQVFLVLSLLFPGIDYRNNVHLDHVHPQTIFTRKKLLQAGVPAHEVDFCLENCDEIPNLQILQNIPNMEKSSQPFAEWLEETYPSEKARSDFLRSQLIPDSDLRLANFKRFFEDRSKTLRLELHKALQVSSNSPTLE